MEQILLPSGKRKVSGKQVKQLRRQGLVPGVLYGQGEEATPLQFEARGLERVLAQAGGSHLVSLKIRGVKEPQPVLVHEVQRDAIRGDLMHVDLYRVHMLEKVKVEVPIVLAGQSPIVRRGEGVLLQGVTTIEIECLPGDLIDAIEVDLADLTELDQTVHVSDLAVPAGVEILSEPDQMIVHISPTTMVAEEEVEEEVVEEAAEIEVVTKRKAEEKAKGE